MTTTAAIPQWGHTRAITDLVRRWIENGLLIIIQLLAGAMLRLRVWAGYQYMRLQIARGDRWGKVRAQGELAGLMRTNEFIGYYSENAEVEVE